MTNVSFDGNSLQTANIITSDVAHESIPTKDAKLYALAHANFSTLPIINYPSRAVRISGTVTGSTIADLDNRLDTFRGYFTNKDSNLDIGYGSGTRRYIATLNALSIDRPRGLAYAEFTAEFICTQPFGQATSATTALNATGRTSGSYSDAHTFVGTAPYQLPVITITINSVTGGNNYLAFTNNSNSQGITLAGRTFVAADVIVIDCKQRIVTLNGDEIDYLGTFAEFAPGSQTMNYADGFTTRNFNINVSYYPLYL